MISQYNLPFIIIMTSWLVNNILMYYLLILPQNWIIIIIIEQYLYCYWLIVYDKSKQTIAFVYLHSLLISKLKLSRAIAKKISTDPCRDCAFDGSRDRFWSFLHTLHQWGNILKPIMLPEGTFLLIVKIWRKFKYRHHKLSAK